MRTAGLFAAALAILVLCGIALNWFVVRRLIRVAVGNALAAEKRRRVTTSVERCLDERTAELRIAQLSHDLRTPLNAILGFTHTMLIGLAGPLSDEQRDQLRLIDDNGHRLLGFIDALLEAADAGSHPAEVSHDERQDQPSAETRA